MRPAVLWAWYVRPVANTTHLGPSTIHTESPFPMDAERDDTQGKVTPRGRCALHNGWAVGKHAYDRENNINININNEVAC